MKDWWNRLWCLHDWKKGFSWRLRFGREYNEYRCYKCGKLKYFHDIPVSYVEKD